MSSALPTPFTAAHRSYVKSLYRRFLTNDLNWTIRRDLWRANSLAIRAEFERNRYVRFGACIVSRLWRPTLLYVNSDVHDPRALAAILEQAEADLAKRLHPEPYRRKLLPVSTGLFGTDFLLQLLPLRTVPNGVLLHPVSPVSLYSSCLLSQGTECSGTSPAAL